MDILLIIIGIILLAIGLVGCLLPIIPGPPIAYISLVLLHLTDKASFSMKQLTICLLLVIILQIVDYIIPTLGVKKMGGGKWGNWGCLFGTLIGVIFFSPWGIIIGPFVGAFLGEALSGKSSHHAFKAGFGAFIGFLFGTILKLILCGWFIFCFFKALIY